jgi:DNA repair protein RadB
MQGNYLPFGIASLDRLLGGGIENGSLTEFYGEGGTGKSNLCLLLACRVVRQGQWVVYLDTEGLSMDRLSQVAGGQGTTLSQVVRRLLLNTPKTLEEQERVVERTSSLMLEREGKIGLVIVDSPTLLYRLALGQEDEETARQSLSTQVATLLHAAIETSIPVVITNQVWRDIHSATFEPIGGSFLSHIAKTIVRLERLQSGWRRATLMKHRSLPEGGTADYRISPWGIQSG